MNGSKVIEQIEAYKEQLRKDTLNQLTLTIYRLNQSCFYSLSEIEGFVTEIIEEIDVEQSRQRARLNHDN